MSWKSFQEDAFDLTQEEIKSLSRKILNNYRQAIKSIEIQLKEVYAKLSGISPENYYNEMIKRDRLVNLLKQIRLEYAKFSNKSGKEIKKILSLSFSNAYYRKLYAASWLTEKNVFGLLPRQLNELTVLGTNEAWKNITESIKNRFGNMNNYLPQKGTLVSLLKNNANKEIDKIQSAIVSSLQHGESYTSVINKIKDAIGREFKDGKKLKITGAKSSALRIIRTETNRTMNAASYAASKNLENRNMEVKRRLIAVLDNRTRRQSARMDGQTVGVDEPFRYPGGVTAIFPGTTGVAKYDINDRETVIDIIDGIEPQARIGRNPETGLNEYFSYKDFDKWADGHGLTKNIYGEYVR